MYLCVDCFVLAFLQFHYDYNQTNNYTGVFCARTYTAYEFKQTNDNDRNRLKVNSLIYVLYYYCI